MEGNKTEDGVLDSKGGAGADGGKTDSQNSNSEPDKKFVSQDDHKRTLDDMHRFKREKIAAEERANTLEAEKKALEEAKLAEANDWEALAKKREAERDSAIQERDSERNSFHDSKKYDAVYRAAAKLGLKKEAESDLDMLKLDTVEIENTDHGRTIIRGADTFAENLMKTKPHWFQSKKAPVFNGGGGAPPPQINGEVTVQDVLRLEKIAKRTGNNKAYYAALEKFNAQKRA